MSKKLAINNLDLPSKREVVKRSEVETGLDQALESIHKDGVGKEPPAVPAQQEVKNVRSSIDWHPQTYKDMRNKLLNELDNMTIMDYVVGLVEMDLYGERKHRLKKS